MDEPDLTLRQLLTECPALCLDPVLTTVLDSKVANLRLEVHTVTPETPLYLPPTFTVRSVQ